MSGPHIAGRILTSFEISFVKCVTILRHNVHTLASLPRPDSFRGPQRSTSTGREGPEAKALGNRLLRIRRNCRTLDQHDQCSNLTEGLGSAANTFWREKWALPLGTPCDAYAVSKLARKLGGMQSTAVEWHFTWQLNDVECRRQVSLANPNNLWEGVILPAKRPIMKTASTLHMGGRMVNGGQFIFHALLQPLVLPLPNMSCLRHVD